jgi:hypothetical protein
LIFIFFLFDLVLIYFWIRILKKMDKKVPRSANISKLDWQVTIGSTIFSTRKHFHSAMKALCYKYNKNECEIIWREGYVKDGWLKCKVKLGSGGTTIEQLLKWVESEFEVDNEIAQEIRKYHPDP